MVDNEMSFFEKIGKTADKTVARKVFDLQAGNIPIVLDFAVAMKI